MMRGDQPGTSNLILLQWPAEQLLQPSGTELCTLNSITESWGRSASFILQVFAVAFANIAELKTVSLLLALRAVPLQTATISKTNKIHSTIYLVLIAILLSDFLFKQKHYSFFFYWTKILKHTKLNYNSFLKDFLEWAKYIFYKELKRIGNNSAQIYLQRSRIRLLYRIIYSALWSLIARIFFLTSSIAKAWFSYMC